VRAEPNVPRFLELLLRINLAHAHIRVKIQVYDQGHDRLSASGGPVPRLRGEVVEAIGTGVGGQPTEARSAGHGGTTAVQINCQSLFVLRRPRDSSWGMALTRGFLINVVVRGAAVLSTESDLLGRITERRSAAHANASGRGSIHHARELRANGVGNTARAISAQRDTTNTAGRSAAAATPTAAAATTTTRGGAAFNVGRSRAFARDIRTTAREGGILTLTRAGCRPRAAFDVGRARAQSTPVASGARNGSVLTRTSAGLCHEFIGGCGVSFQLLLITKRESFWGEEIRRNDCTHNC